MFHEPAHRLHENRARTYSGKACDVGSESTPEPYVTSSSFGRRTIGVDVPVEKKKENIPKAVPSFTEQCQGKKGEQKLL